MNKPCNSDCYSFNPNTFPNDEVLQSSILIGNSGVTTSSSIDFPFGNNSVNNGNVLSHVGIATALMFPNLNPNERKTPSSFEESILCELGVNVNSCTPAKECSIPIESKMPFLRNGSSSEFSQCCKNVFHTCTDTYELSLEDILCFSNNTNASEIEISNIWTSSTDQIESNIINGPNGPSIEITRLTFGSSSSCLLYTSPSPRDQRGSRMPSSA